MPLSYNYPEMFIFPSFVTQNVIAGSIVSHLIINATQSDDISTPEYCINTLLWGALSYNNPKFLPLCLSLVIFHKDSPMY